MGILAGTRGSRRASHETGRWVMVPKEVTAPMRRRARVLQRRRRLFVRLLLTSVITLVAGFFPPVRWSFLLHLVADAALVLYVVRLRQWKREEAWAIANAQPAPLPLYDSPTQQPLHGGVVLPASVPPPPRAEPAEIVTDELITRIG